MVVGCGFVNGYWSVFGEVDSRRGRMFSCIYS